MRLVLATTVLLGLAFFGYASAGAGVSVVQGQGQAAQVLSPGDKVILRFAPPDGGGRDCTVLAIRSDFVQCEVPQSRQFGQPSPERWYNLRVVAIIDRPAR